MGTKTFLDQMGNPVVVSFPPKRIVSLVPSQTELLASFELDDEVLGITKFCVHPESWRKKKLIIGGTKNFQLEQIHQIQPDLILGNKEENYQEGIEELMKHYPVWMSDIRTPDDALVMIGEIGHITGKAVEAKKLITAIQQSWTNMMKLPPLRVLYLIWRKPWMGVASGTFIHGMLHLAGLKNCLTQQSRYPQLTDEEVRSIKPDYVFLSSEPYPFKEKHIQELQNLLPSSKILLVDGEIFSWYGSRMQMFADYIANLRSRLI